MTLRLTIENVAALTSGDPVEREINEHGLVIGRAAHADWTLPDPRNWISSRHCEIDYRDGCYILTDCSTNGTMINGAGQRMTGPHRLADNDLITIGHYEIRVALSGAAAQLGAALPPASGGNPFGGGVDWLATQDQASKPADLARFGRPEPRPIFQSAADPMMAAFAPPPPAATPFEPPLGAGDPFGLSGSGSAFAPPPPPAAPVHPAAPNPFGAPAGPAAAPPVMADPFGIGGTSAAPPAPPFPAPPPAPPSAWDANPFGATMTATAPAVPAGPAPADDPWAKLQQSESIDFGAMAAAFAPPAAPAPAQPAFVAPAAPAAAAAQAAGDAGSLFGRFLAAAGLKREELAGAAPESVLEAAGQLLRQTADGLIRLLDARARVRHEFGIGGQVTAFQRVGNNPLKWTRSPEQALRQLVGAPDPGFLAGPQAVRGAFEDIQAHELAMLAAMREAMQETIQRFAPETIRQRATGSGWLNRVLPGARDAALWQVYEREFKALADESEAAYLDLFAKRFRKAYERNVQKADAG